MLQRVLQILGTVALVSLFAGCTPATLATPEPVSIRIAGSTEMMPVLKELAEAFRQRHHHVLFYLQAGGSTLGEARLAGGEIDLAASTLLYGDDELPSGLVRVPIALDAIALIVHADNPLEEITLSQLRDLYTGRLLDWEELGSDSGEVLLISREDGSGTRYLFEQRVMGDERVALTAVVMPTSMDVVSYVSTHPQAVGYVSRAYLADQTADSTVDPHDVKILALEGTVADRDSTASQQYYLSRPLFLLRRTGDREWSQQFIDFVLSPAGQAIVERYHVPVR